MEVLSQFQGKLLRFEHIMVGLKKDLTELENKNNRP